MKKKIDKFLYRNQQYVQGNAAVGVQKGIIVDVRDPSQLGRVRVWIYGMHGDAANLDPSVIDWSEVAHSLRGAFSPPEVWDRAIVAFESGSKDAPVVIGYWRANPTGRGSLPHSSPTGSEIRPEAWHQNNLYPAGRIIGSSGAGNTIWMEDKVLNDDSVASVIAVEDTGGKLIRTRSYHTQQNGYAGTPVTPSGPGAFQGGDNVEANAPIRSGTETVTDPVAGSIDLGHQNLFRTMIATEDTFTLDQLTQANDDGIGVVQQSIGGDAHATQQGNAFALLMDDAIYLHSQNAVMVPQLLSPPQRWD